MQNTNNLNDTKMAIKNEQDGDNLLQKKFYFFGNKYEDAIIKYQLAANIYKIGKNYWPLHKFAQYPHIMKSF